MDSLIGIGIFLALVLVNAFFVAAEFSIVTVRRTRVEQLVALVYWTIYLRPGAEAR